MPPDPIIPLLHPAALGIPGQIVAGFRSGQDPVKAANALTVLCLRVSVARGRLGDSASLAALDRLDGEIRMAISALRRITGAAAEPEFP